MKKYEIMKTSTNFWELYYLDKEFNCWEFIKGFDNKTPIKEIYDLIKDNNKKSNDIIQVKFLNNNI